MKIHRILFILLILIIPLGQFSRIPLGDSSITIYINDLILPLIFGFWLIDVVYRQEKFVFPFLTLPIFLFLGIDVLSLVWNKQFLSGTDFFVSALYLWRWLMYMGIYFVGYDLIKIKNSNIKNQNLENKKARNKELNLFVNLLIGTGFAVAVLGLVQYILFPDFSSMVAQGWDPHYFRVLSTFFDPNYVGAFLVLNLVLLLILTLEVKSWQKLDLIKGILGIVFLAAIILTFSRSTYLMLGICLGIIGFLRSRQLLILGILVAVLTFLLIPRVQERVVGAIHIDETAGFRIESWQKGWQIAKQNLGLGVGYNAFRYAQIRYDLIQSWEETDFTSHASSGVDSSLLLILATTGIPGLLVYLWFLFRQASLGIISYFQTKSYWSKVLGLTVLAGLIGLLVHSQFVNSLLYPFILEWFMIVMGLLEGVKENGFRQRRTSFELEMAKGFRAI